jgi:hypothetical protein
MEILRMKRTLGALIWGFLPTGAIAEVCDKVRPDWNPSDGPVGPFEDVVLFFVTPFGLILLALAVASVLVRRTWLTALTTVIMTAVLAPFWSEWGEDNEVMRLAIAEGCRAAASPILIIVVLVTLAIIPAVATWRSPRSRRKSAPP